MSPAEEKAFIEGPRSDEQQAGCTVAATAPHVQVGEAGAPEVVGCRLARATKAFPGDHFRETTMSKTLALALAFVALRRPRKPPPP